MLTPYKLKLLLVENVASRYGVKPEQILSTSRKRKKAVLQARQHAMALMLVSSTKENYRSVARFFGRNHSTVIYDVAKFFGAPTRATGAPHKGYAKIASDGLNGSQRQALQDEARIVLEAHRHEEARHAA
jgi:hypothetical protein